MADHEFELFRKWEREQARRRKEIARRIKADRENWKREKKKPKR